jgi:hypothetical protein
VQKKVVEEPVKVRDRGQIPPCRVHNRWGKAGMKRTNEVENKALQNKCLSRRFGNTIDPVDRQDEAI